MSYFLRIICQFWILQHTHSDSDSDSGILQVYMYISHPHGNKYQLLIALYNMKWHKYNKQECSKHSFYSGLWLLFLYVIYIVNVCSVLPVVCLCNEANNILVAAKWLKCVTYLAILTEPYIASLQFRVLNTLLHIGFSYTIAHSHINVTISGLSPRNRVHMDMQVSPHHAQKIDGVYYTSFWAVHV